MLKTVLAVLPVEPHPEGYGSQKRAAAHLSALVDANRVHLVVLVSRDAKERAGDALLFERCESVAVVKYRWRPRQIITKMAPFPTLAELFDPTVKRWLPSPAQVREAFRHVVEKQIDVALCFKLLGATIFDYAQSIVPLRIGRRIVDFDDIQSLADQRALAYEKQYGFEQSIIDSLVRWQIRRAEDRCLATYDAVWICSETDRCNLLSRAPRAEIQTIPNSVGLEDASIAIDDRPDVRLLFVGSLGYGPNQDGIVWFCSEILPRIRKSSSRNVKLTIVGFNPPAEVRVLESAGDIVVTGGVESVAPYYRDSDIVIAPIRYGSGTRIKILEAMSHRRPVVATTLGAEGIDVRPGEDIMIGDTPEAFAASCLELIQNSGRRRSIAQLGRRLIEEKYSDRTIAAAINKAI